MGCPPSAGSSGATPDRGSWANSSIPLQYRSKRFGKQGTRSSPSFKLAPSYHSGRCKFYEQERGGNCTALKI